MNVNVCTRVRVLHLYLNYTICLRSAVNNSTCLLGDAILCIPFVSPTLIGHARYARVRAYRAWDMYDGVFRLLQKGSHISNPVIFSSVAGAPLLGRTFCIVNTAAGMASSGDFYTVKLLENEVSGVVLLHSDVSQNYVISLKRWLECRGFLTKGNKRELVKMSVHHQPGDGLCSWLSISYTFRWNLNYLCR